MTRALIGHGYAVSGAVLRLVLLTAMFGLGSAACANDTISDIVVEGNTRTVREVVVDALGVRPGDRVPGPGRVR